MGPCMSKSGAKSGGGASDQNVSMYYEIGEELGSGAFSTVKLGVDKENGDQVALKMIPNSIFLKNKAATEREVQILEQIGNHPNIVKLLRVIRGKKHFTIAMELLTGRELFERICDREKYTEEDARVIAKQLLEAIAFLHSNNIAHRDLKPENAIFETKEEDALLKVSDFGFANVYDPESRFVATCGTPLYVAPEILDAVPYDVQCDMWSFGVILYILLCGYPPFYGETDTYLFDRIRDADYEFQSPNWDGISDEAKNLIKQTFRLDPKKRIRAKEALKHPWIASTQNNKQLSTAVDELKRTQCKRKLIKGVYAVIAMNRFSHGSLK